ncbi:hypothetical protein KXX16_001376 [Aspergillus fumigatus]|nr:hypothetical protein KXX16_001376 [Aspergillus fumigatus]KAH2396889.1 hypothetical protein KXW92_004511 [Aspergillus fumigatus]KAH3157786.1 hypothetical protein KXW80_006541 [Aspergillus fumigatus]KAH3471098.1 hypothetical protein KXX05_007403 [Aspergillus fumigatus]
MLEHETMTPQHLFKLPVELVVETAQYLARWASSSVGGPGGPGGPLSPHQTGQREHRPTYCTKRTRQWKEYRHLVDSDGDNLLHRAVKRSRPIADIAFLLDEELDVNHRNGQGRTPLAVAIAIKNSARIKKPDIVELLLQREQRPTFQTTGPDILCIERLSTRKHGLYDCWRNMTPTSRARTSHALLDAGANMDVPASDPVGSICGGDNNSTALTWAVRGGKLEAMQELRSTRSIAIDVSHSLWQPVTDIVRLLDCWSKTEQTSIRRHTWVARRGHSLQIKDTWRVLYAGSFVCHRTTRKRVKEPEMTQLVDHLTPGLVVDFPLLRRARHERRRETWELGVAQALFQPAVFG